MLPAYRRNDRFLRQFCRHDPDTGILIAQLNVNPDIPVAIQELETFGWGSTTYAEAQDDFPNIPQTANYCHVPPQECNMPTGLETSNTILCAWAERSAIGGGDSGMCIIYIRCHLTIHD